MRQTKVHLSPAAREKLDKLRSKGLHSAREVNRAHILAALSRRVPETQIREVLGVGRTAIWRTRAAFCEGGLDYALHDLPRTGKPRRYKAEAEAEITALACSNPPAGARRWTIRLLTSTVRTRPHLQGISRESIRRFLKKTSLSLGVE